MDQYQFPSVTQLAIPFFVAAILIELWLVRTGRARGEFETRDTLTSLMMGTGNVVAGILLGVVSYTALLWVWQFRLFDLGLSLGVFLVAFLLDDLRYYAYHRIAHRVRWVWAEHINHHSSQHYNLSTALRQSWTGLFTGMFVLQVPLVLLGFHPAWSRLCLRLQPRLAVLDHETIGRCGGPSTRSSTRRRTTASPATNPLSTPTMPAPLIIWTDVRHLRGGLEDRPRYGIVRNLGTFNPLKVAFHEWIIMFKDAAPG